MRSILFPLFVLLALVVSAAAQSRADYPPEIDGADVHVYRTIGDVGLNAHVFRPGTEFEGDRPAIVFFFGGGWRNGTPTQFEQHCRYLATRGMVAITCDYRVLSRHGTPASACVADAKAAVRWIRENAETLGVDPARIAAGGGSAGGHLAACTGVIDGFEPEDANLDVSSRPEALVLFNPALVLAPYNGGDDPLKTRQAELEERMGVPPQELSPIHHIGSNEPPTIIFHGEADTTVAFRTARAFASVMKKRGNRCELKAYPNESHGFFNYGRNDNRAFIETLTETDEFLSSLGWLEGSPSVKAFLAP